MSTTIKPGLYKHFKGGTYLVLMTATDSETEAECVVYVSLRGGGIWVRPAAMFVEHVKWPDGEERPRFVMERESPAPLEDLREHLDRARSAAEGLAAHAGRDHPYAEEVLRHVLGACDALRLLSLPSGPRIG